jgi:hypothetical protein
MDEPNSPSHLTPDDARAMRQAIDRFEEARRRASAAEGTAFDATMADPRSAGAANFAMHLGHEDVYEARAALNRLIVSAGYGGIRRGDVLYLADAETGNLIRVDLARDAKEFLDLDD